jgi:hypothetical protein
MDEKSPADLETGAELRQLVERIECLEEGRKARQMTFKRPVASPDPDLPGHPRR